jgi:hypothetical protein
VTAFEIRLDPLEVADLGRSELLLNDWSGAFMVESVDWGDASIQEYLADQRYGSRKIDYRIPNRTVIVTLIVGGDGNQATFDAARTALTQKVALFQREGGTLARQQGLYADVVGATLHLPDQYGETGFVEHPVTLTLECLPDFYGDEIHMTIPSLTGLCAGLLHGPDTPTTKVRGDYPARVRLVVGGSSADDHSLWWGFRSKNYDGASTAALFQPCSLMTPLNGAGASAGTVSGVAGPLVKATPPPGQWVPILTTSQTTQTKTVCTAAADGGSSVGTVAWTSLTGVAAGTADTTKASLGAGAQSHLLEVSGFGFALSGDAIVTGIEVAITKKCTNAFVTDTTVELMKVGAATGSNKALAGAWPTADATANYGSGGDQWGTTWSPTDVNNTGFGVAISVTASSADVAFVSEVAITLHYMRPTYPIPLTHVGSYRVWLRAMSVNATPQLRLAWGTGGISQAINAAVSLPAASPTTPSFFMLDMGEVRLDMPSVGSPQWFGSVQAFVVNSGDEIELDCMYLQPLDESAGFLQAVLGPSPNTIAVTNTGPPPTGSTGTGTQTWTDESFGFALPAGANIQGIQVNVSRYSSGTGSPAPARDSSIKLRKNVSGVSTPVGSDRSAAATWSTSPSVATFGGPIDLWGTTWTYTDINDPLFGTTLVANVFTGWSATVSSITITVYYVLAQGYAVVQDAIIYANGGSNLQKCEIRTDGVYRSDPAGVLWSSFGGVQQGDLPRLPPSGADGRSCEVFVRSSATEGIIIPDTLDTGHTIDVYYRPCYLARS